MVPNRLAVVKATCWIGSGWLSLQYVPKPLLWWVTVMYLGCCFSPVDKICFKKCPSNGHLLLINWGIFTFSRVRKAVWKHPQRFDFCWISSFSKSISQIPSPATSLTIATGRGGWKVISPCWWNSKKWRFPGWNLTVGSTNPPSPRYAKKKKRETQVQHFSRYKKHLCRNLQGD